MVYDPSDNNRSPEALVFSSGLTRLVVEIIYQIKSTDGGINNTDNHQPGFSSCISAGSYLTLVQPTIERLIV